MKAKLKLLSLACLSLTGGMAFADSTASTSSVTIYGVLDVGVAMLTSTAPGYATATKSSTNSGRVLKMQDGGIGASYFGFKGNEDLGGGMSAHFQLQGNFNDGTGAGSALGGSVSSAGGAVPTMFNQISTVGLKGRFGDVSVGRQFTPAFLSMASTDVRSGSYFGGILGALVGINSSTGKWTGASTNAPLGTVYDDNSIVYTSPDMAGVVVSGEYVVGGVAGNASAGSRESATVQYQNGGLKLSGIFYDAHDANPGTTTPTGTLNNQLISAGAMYTRQGWSASIDYAVAKNPSSPGVSNYSILSAGLGYQVSPTIMITSGVYRLTDRNVSANRSTLVAATLNYSLSKRTMLYVEAGTVANSGNMNQGLIYTDPTPTGVRTTGTMVGIRHAF